METNRLYLELVVVGVVSLRLLDVVVAARGVKCENRRQRFKVEGVDVVVE